MDKNTEFSKIQIKQAFDCQTPNFFKETDNISSRNTYFS